MYPWNKSSGSQRIYTAKSGNTAGRSGDELLHNDRLLQTVSIQRSQMCPHTKTGNVLPWQQYPHVARNSSYCMTNYKFYQPLYCNPSFHLTKELNMSYAWFDSQNHKTTSAQSPVITLIGGNSTVVWTLQLVNPYNSGEPEEVSFRVLNITQHLRPHLPSLIAHSDGIRTHTHAHSVSNHSKSLLHPSCVNIKHILKYIVQVQGLTVLYIVSDWKQREQFKIDIQHGKKRMADPPKERKWRYKP